MVKDGVLPTIHNRAMSAIAKIGNYFYVGWMHKFQPSNGWMKPSVKIPLMAQAFTISLFLTLRGGFMAYDVNLALTGGGPYRSTELISMHIFQDAFRLGNFDTGQSKAVIMFIMVAVAALVQVSVSKRMEVQR